MTRPREVRLPKFVNCRTQTRNRVSGGPYVTYRLVHSVRVDNAIKQTTVLTR